MTITEETLRHKEGIDFRDITLSEGNVYDRRDGVSEIVIKACYEGNRYASEEYSELNEFLERFAR